MKKRGEVGKGNFKTGGYRRGFTLPAAIRASGIQEMDGPHQVVGGRG